MKLLALLTVMVMFLTIPLNAQIIREIGTDDLFDDTDWTVTEVEKRKKVVGIPSPQRYLYHYVSSDTLADTLTSVWIPNTAYGDHHLSFTMVNDSDATGAPDTIISVLEMGVFRGHGTVPGTAGGTVDSSGVLWKHMITVSQDTSVGISLRDSTWWTDFPVSKYCYRFRETSAQKNDYYLNDFSFKTR